MKSLLLAGLLALSFFSPPVHGQQAETKQAIRATFQQMNMALAAGQGSAAAALVDAATIRHFDRLLMLANTTDTTVFDTLKPADKVSVNMLRQAVPAERLTDLTGKGLVAYAVQTGALGKNSLATLRLGAIAARGNSASASLFQKGKKLPVKAYFTREEDGWKINLTSLLPAAERALARLPTTKGAPDGSFLRGLMEISRKSAQAGSMR